MCRNPEEFRRANEWVRDVLAGSDHVEVVPAAPLMFSLDVRGSCAYGRGAADMKTQVVMLLWVLRDPLTDDDHHDFWLVLTEDEEVGSQGGRAHPRTSAPR